jgi:hypothetical protein
MKIKVNAAKKLRRIPLESNFFETDAHMIIDTPRNKDVNGQHINDR